MDQKKTSLTVEERYRRVCKLIEISERVVADSPDIAEDLKQTYLAGYQENKADALEYVETKNNSFLKQLEDEVLTPWNETYDEDSNRFWRLVRQNGIDIERVNYLEKILQRGRIASFKEFNIVQDSLVIWLQEGQITAQQADQLSQMLSAYESKRAA